MSDLKGGPLVWAIRDARGIPGNVKHLLHVVASRGESGCTSRWDVVAGDMGVGKSAFYSARTTALELGLLRAHRRWDDTTVYLVDSDILQTYLDHSGNREITLGDHSGNQERQSANQDDHSGNQDGQSANQEPKKNLQNLQNVQNHRSGDEDEAWRLLVESFNCTDVPNYHGDLIGDLETNGDYMVEIEPYAASRDVIGGEVRVKPCGCGEAGSCPDCREGAEPTSKAPEWKQERWHNELTEREGGIDATSGTPIEDKPAVGYRGGSR